MRSCLVVSKSGSLPAPKSTPQSSTRLPAPTCCTRARWAISAGGGILLWAEQELPVGTTLYLFIHSDELAEIELEATATIVRVDPTKKDGRFGYGCRFEALYNNPHAD
ncbi:PilZ domain-containing protein [Candidatus Competibacter phosphatis]|uniref:PilZ domain-containing protein n=1 Tax=Candidatus Competibacter phosphatis TaxID=221280 RepID=UPI0028A6BDB8|nr:PilZ domain-containing protein [Candidatus Competibacter phosphatis]